MFAWFFFFKVTRFLQLFASFAYFRSIPAEQIRTIANCNFRKEHCKLGSGPKEVKNVNICSTIYNVSPIKLAVFIVQSMLTIPVKELLYGEAITSANKDQKASRLNNKRYSGDIRGEASRCKVWGSETKMIFLAKRRRRHQASKFLNGRRRCHP
jgi:hypothetical protein